MTRNQRESRHEIRDGLAAGEGAAGRARRILSSRFGRNQPAFLAAYTGYADASGTHLSGRVLSKPPGGGPSEQDTLWRNIINTWQRWESDEVVGAEVSLEFENHHARVTSDREGYHHATLPRPATTGSSWSSAMARVRTESREVSATHEVLTPPPQAEFGVISDLDDTVIHTGITSILLAAKLTFLENAVTRKPLDGVAGLYSALQHGTSGLAVNPIFYVSSSPWNLYDLLSDFIRLNRIPRGPMLLRDFGIDRAKWMRESGHDHKLEKVLALLDGYPDLPFVLIGDSGQEDAGIYAKVCERRPGRIRAIYIRDIDPDFHSLRDAAVHRAVDRAASHGVTMVLASDSVAMSRHASEIGLIPDSVVSEVVAQVQADEALPETGEQALKDAAHAVVPHI
jgi:phosphatidate phosphatase APP1